MGRLRKALKNFKNDVTKKASDFIDSTAGKVTTGILTGGVSTLVDALGGDSKPEVSVTNIDNNNATAASEGRPTLPNTVESFKPRPNPIQTVENYQQPGTDAYKTEVENNAKATEDSIVSATNTAKAAATSGVNEGENKSSAGTIGSAATNSNAAEVYNQMQPAFNSQNASTQADYLEKMGQTKGLEYKAQNMNKANWLNTFGALLGSDEKLKTKRGMLGKKKEDDTPGNLDPEQLNKAIAQFRSLYKRLQQLKEAQ